MTTPNNTLPDYQKFTLEELIADQEQLEVRMRNYGVDKLHTRIEKYSQIGKGSYLPGTNHVVSRMITPLSTTIRDYTLHRNATQKQPSQKLLQLSPDEVSLISLRVLFDLHCQAEVTYQLLVRRIGSVLEAEVQQRWAEIEDPKLYLNISRKIGRQLTAQRASQHAIGRHINKLYEGYESWGISTQMKVGMIVVGMMEQLGIISIYLRRVTKSRSKRYIKLSHDIIDYIDRKQNNENLIRPFLQPTVIPPAKWETGEMGGYWFQIFNPPPIISGAGVAQIDHFNKNRSDNVLRSLNIIQDVPWQINLDVLAMQKDLWERGGYGDLIAAQDDVEVPPKPKDNAKLLTSWKETAHRIHVRNNKMKAKRILQFFTMDIAKRYSKYEHIYFPHRYDFRGRCYPLCAHMQPQGCDQAKGLIRFSNKKQLGSQGLYWLGVHGANLFGYDKVPMRERFRWAEEQEDNVRKTFNNPHQSIEWWSQADKPWQFLAWAKEWHQALQEGETFESSLPIAMDGTCNGIQHLSAIMRDPVGGAAVNLLPSEVPQDIYQRVADRVMELLRDTGTEKDKLWLTIGVSRKITKRTVMVLPYGGTFHACMDYVRDGVLEHLKTRNETYKDHGFEHVGDFKKELCRFAKYVWQATHEILPCAKQAMGWLQEVAKILSAEQKGLLWTSPMGFPVYQNYRRFDEKRITTKLFGKQINMFARTARPEVNKRKQQSAISPNYIHSLDAACLQLTTVSACDAYGITDFHMVHDSYGTHACDTDNLNKMIRECFIAIHKDNPLEQFKEEIEGNTGITLPDLPEKGTLDISEVANSEYFFA